MGGSRGLRKIVHDSRVDGFGSSEVCDGVETIIARGAGILLVDKVDCGGLMLECVQLLAVRWVWIAKAQSLIGTDWCDKLSEFSLL